MSDSKSDSKPKSKNELPEWELSDDDGGIHTMGGPDALSAGAWGTFDPVMVDLELYLDNLEYPVSQTDLVEHLRRRNAPEMMVITIEQIPDQEFTSAADIMRALGQIE
jgi:hypothetical protein